MIFYDYHGRSSKSNWERRPWPSSGYRVMWSNNGSEKVELSRQELGHGPYGVAAMIEEPVVGQL